MNKIIAFRGDFVLLRKNFIILNKFQTTFKFYNYVTRKRNQISAFKKTKNKV